jgi:outer membrane murein-binding lipoprotein Lpp
MLSKINQNSHSPADLAARVRKLAAHAEAVASAIAELHHDVQAAHDDSARRAGFRCDTAIGCAREAAAGELRDTAADLDRTTAAAALGTCPVPWGVCPEHGNTLTSSGGRTWCRDARCDRTWSYDRTGLPCTEPVRWTVTDQHRDTVVMCDGHTLDAANRLDGTRTAPLPAAHRKELA